jgi:hypothetical protein
MVNIDSLTNRKQLLNSVRIFTKNRKLPHDPKIVGLNEQQLRNRLLVLSESNTPTMSKNVKYINSNFTEVNKNNIQRSKRVYIVDEALQTGGVVKRVYNKDGLIKWLNLKGGKEAKSPFTRVKFSRSSIVNLDV